MKKPSSLSVFLACLLVIAFAAVVIIQRHQRGEWAEARKPTPKKTEVTYPRIVSLVPSVTETLYMLGLGDHIVARSTFCDFPDVVTNLPAVGSLGNVNIEAIARLKPDFVLLSDAQAQSKIHTALAKLKINHLGVPANSLNDIFQSVWDLSQRFDAGENATLWLEHMNAVMDKAKEKAPSKAPRILVCAGRDAASLDRLYISGKGNFYEGVMKVVGGVNAYEGAMPTPMVSLEGVVKMNPDIIVDVVLGDPSGESVLNALCQWGDLATINAVKTGDVHILTEPWAVRPGPRIDMLIKTLSGYVEEWNGKNEN